MSWKQILIKAGLMMEGSFHFVGGGPQGASQGICTTYLMLILALTTILGISARIGQDFANRAQQLNADCVVAAGVDLFSMEQFTAYSLGLPFFAYHEVCCDLLIRADSACY